MTSKKDEFGRNCALHASAPGEAASSPRLRNRRPRQHGARPAAEASPGPDDAAVCLLDVPVHKTGTAFTKPVDPIIGQASGGGPRVMDEPAPNYPAGNRRTALEMPDQFVVLTAAAYFFMPSIAALRTVLT